ncbi:MAG: pseudouridine synthase, partial [Burkholderiales bacterium]
RGPADAGEKLQKVLARAGLGSRREMEVWIAAGRVTVNGARAHLGQRVSASDRVRVDDRPVGAGTQDAPARVLLYHKPSGEIVSAADPGGRATVFDRLPRVKGGRWIAVGRLDLTSSGLLVLTTSGELAAQLMHPRSGLEREYAVRVDGTLAPEALRALTRGVLLEDGPARFATIADEGGQGRNHWYRVVLREGRNREVRRMLEAVNHRVSRLIRVRFGPLVLPPGLKRGWFRELRPGEVAALAAGVSGDRPGQPLSPAPRPARNDARKGAPAGPRWGTPRAPGPRRRVRERS